MRSGTESGECVGAVQAEDWVQLGCCRIRRDVAWLMMRGA